MSHQCTAVTVRAAGEVLYTLCAVGHVVETCRRKDFVGSRFEATVGRIAVR